jgi:hypothetical protein
MSSLLVIIVWGVIAIFLGSESGHKQSVTLLQNMVYSTTQHPPPPSPHSHTLSVYTVLYIYFGKGREVREKVEGQQYTKGVENTNMTDCISSQ